MLDLNISIGRMGNQLFKYAALYTFLRDNNISIEAGFPYFPYYLQDPKYFDKYGDELRQWLSWGVEKSGYIAMHVRRTDYTELPFYTDLFSTGYYARAMQEFPEEKFLIFSDDIPWCKEQEIFKDCHFSELDPLNDFNRMAGCKGHIIANSSYSWWAAYIANGKTVAPKDWHTDGVDRTVCPKEWIKI